MYKVIINNEKGLDKILVFNGNVNVTSDLLKTDPNNSVFKSIVNEEDIKDIIENNIDVVFTNLSIFKDDTIYDIKLKITKVLEKSQLDYRQIYLYVKKKHIFNASDVYNTLTYNDSYDLTYKKLITYWLNTDLPEIELKSI